MKQTPFRFGRHNCFKESQDNHEQCSGIKHELFNGNKQITDNTTEHERQLTRYIHIVCRFSECHADDVSHSAEILSLYIISLCVVLRPFEVTISSSNKHLTMRDYHRCRWTGSSSQLMQRFHISRCFESMFDFTSQLWYYIYQNQIHHRQRIVFLKWNSTFTCVIMKMTWEMMTNH